MPSKTSKFKPQTITSLWPIPRAILPPNKVFKSRLEVSRQQAKVNLKKEYRHD